MSNRLITVNVFQLSGHATYLHISNRGPGKLSKHRQFIKTSLEQGV